MNTDAEVGPAPPRTIRAVIYINLDHPLYKRQLRSLDAHTMHLARLMAQEIALMKAPKDARGAFARQSQLLRDGFQDA